MPSIDDIVQEVLDNNESSVFSVSKSLYQRGFADGEASGVARSAPAYFNKLKDLSEFMAENASITFFNLNQFRLTLQNRMLDAHGISIIMSDEVLSTYKYDWMDQFEANGNPTAMAMASVTQSAWYPEPANYTHITKAIRDPSCFIQYRRNGVVYVKYQAEDADVPTIYPIGLAIDLKFAFQDMFYQYLKEHS